MWKLCNNLIPTKYFISNRLHNDNLDPSCSLCHAAAETVTHLFKDCSIAAQCWGFLDRWWVAIQIPLTCDDWLWKAYMAANNTIYKDKWQTTISALLWTVWLNRNEKIFRSTHNTSKQMKFLICHRSYTWCTSSGIILSNSEQDWAINPIKTAKSVYIKFQKHLDQYWDYYAFVDGSWNKVGGIQRAGMGGFIKHKNDNKQFLFSGPTVAEDPLQAETDSILIVLNEIHLNIPSDKKVIMHTDSQILWNNIQLFKAGLVLNIPFAENIHLGLLQNVTITYISRTHNRGANYLAKQGLHKPRLVKGWI